MQTDCRIVFCIESVSLSWSKSISFLITFCSTKEKLNLFLELHLFFWLPKYSDVVCFSELFRCLPASRVFSSARITDLLWSGIFRFLTILENNYQKPLQSFIVLNYLIINGCQFFHLKWHYLQNRIFLFPFFLSQTFFSSKLLK